MRGTTVGGRYVVEGLLGRGGMGEVWRARDTELDRVVAVKVMSATTPKAVAARFRREMDACARMTHPNVIRLFDTGMLPDGSPYCVIELLEGKGLDEYLDDRGRLDPAEVLTLVRQMTEALEHAHGMGVVHRDLKPANVFVVPGRGAVVMDFGLARVADRTQLTKTGSHLGTPLYMSPELALGHAVDGRSDLWQVGVMAYEMLTGRNPFMGETLQAVLSAVLSRRPAPPTTVVAGLARGWDTVVGGCLVQDPEGRYPTAAALLADLDRLAEGETPVGPPTEDGGGRLSGALTPVALVRTPTSVLRTVASSRRGALASVACVLALALVILGRGGGEGGAVPVRELAVSTGWRRAEVRWVSDGPYESRIELLEPFRRVIRGGADPTTEHRVAVEGLPEDGRFEFQILLPSGVAGLPQRERTTAPAMVLDGAEIVGEGLRLSWKGCPPQGVERIDGGCAVDVEDLGDGGRLLVRGDPRRLRDVVVTAVSPVGERVGLSVASRLAQQVEALVAGMRPYEPGATVAAMKVHRQRDITDAFEALNPGPERRARDAASKERQAAAVREHLGRGGVMERYREATRWAPAVFETGLVEEELRRAVAEQLGKILYLEAYVRGTVVDLLLTPRPWLGDYGMTESPRFEPARVLSVRGADEEPLHLGMPPPWRPPGSVQEWTGAVVVDPASASGRAELAVEIRRLMRSTLTVQVGTAPPVLVHDLPATAGEVHHAPWTVYVGVPPGSLRPGRTTVVIRHVCLFDKVDEREANVGAVSLRIPRP